VVCGKSFKGIASAQTCTPACRIDLVRLKEAGRRPEYILMAKSKGQKIPDLNAPKRLFFKKGEKKSKVVQLPIGNKIKYATVTHESFDAPPVSNLIMDEVGQTAPPLTKEEIFQKISDLEKQKKVVSERNILSGSPKANALQKAMEIDEINEKIEQLKILMSSNKE